MSELDFAGEHVSFVPVLAASNNSGSSNSDNTAESVRERSCSDSLNLQAAHAGNSDGTSGDGRLAFAEALNDYQEEEADWRHELLLQAFPCEADQGEELSQAICYARGCLGASGSSGSGSMSSGGAMANTIFPVRTNSVTTDKAAQTEAWINDSIYAKKHAISPTLVQQAIKKHEHEVSGVSVVGGGKGLYVDLSGSEVVNIGESEDEGCEVEKHAF